MRTKKCGPKKLALDTINKIRVLYRNGNCTQCELAQKFNLSQSTISKIVNNTIHKKTNGINISGSAEVKFTIGFKYGN